MIKKLRVTIFVLAMLSIATLLSINSRAFVPLTATPTVPLPPLTTVNIPPGSVMYIAPNNADSTFAANLQDRMNYEGLFAPPYSLSITTNSAAANYWLMGSVDEIYIPDEWRVGALYVVNPTTKQILNAYMSRAAGSYDELYVCRKLAQNGLKPDVHY